MRISAPLLAQKRQRPAKYFVGDAPAEFSESAEEHYRRIYFEAMDTVVKCVEFGFNQKDYSQTYAKLESLLLTAAKGEQFEEQIGFV